MAKDHKDPTADVAIGRIMKKERIKKKLFKDAVEKLAYVCGLRVHLTYVRRDCNDYHKN